MVLYRKRLEEPAVPASVEILWGDDVGGTRLIMDSNDSVGAIQARLDAYPSSDLYERNQIASGAWILRTYSSPTAKQYLEIREGTATLVSDVLTMNNSELIEE